MQDMVFGYASTYKSEPTLTSFIYSMYGVKKLTNNMHSYPTLAYKPSRKPDQFSLEEY